MTVMEVGGHAVEPATKVRKSMPFVELADGTAVSLPLLLINGARPGPRLYLGAAIHGDEVNGVAILFRALAAIDPARLAGSIVCVPVQHPLAFHADHRIPVSQYMKSPLDQAPLDAWTVFPGNEHGNLAQLLAAKLFSLIKTCDYAIDIHCPTRGGRYVPIAILPHPNLGEARQRARAMADAFGSGWIMDTEKSFYVSNGILCVEATRAGVPAFTFEIGEGGRLEDAAIDEGARCIRNVMRWLDMMPGAPERPAKTHVMRDFLEIRGERGGLLLNRKALGDLVKKGDVLARVFNIYGDEVQTVTAPADAVFVRTTTLSTVSTGERVATLVPTIMIRWHRGRPSPSVRPGAGPTVMRHHHKGPATPPAGADGRPWGRARRSPGASKPLADGAASPSRLLLPGKRRARSYVSRNHDSGY